MSYMRSSYKTSSSSYRYSSDTGGGGVGNTNGIGSSRFRSSIQSSNIYDDDTFGTSSLTSSSYSTIRNRTSNYEPTSSLPIRNYDDDDDYIGSLSRNRSSYQTSRITATATTASSHLDSDYDLIGGGDRFHSTTTSNRYKITNIDDDDDNLSSRKYSRYSSRDENESSTTATTTRISRYSSIDTSNLRSNDDDDFNIRRRKKYNYLDDDENDENDDINNQDRYYTTKRKTFKQSLSYDVKSPSISDDIDNRLSSYYDNDKMSSFDRRRSAALTSSSSMNRSLSRMDSKDAQIYQVILDYKPPRSATDEISLKEGQEVIVISKDKPHKWKVRTRKSINYPKIEEGFAPSAYLKPTNEKLDSNELSSIQQQQQQQESIENERSIKSDQTKDLNKKKDMIIRELIETEEDLIRDMQFVVRTYVRQSESSITPKEIRNVKDSLFNCYKELLDFHKDVLLKNFQTLSKEPNKIGQLFLKLQSQSQFINHTRYCQNLQKALDILDENSDVAEYFNNYSIKIRDEKPLSDRLKLPLQRLNDYQLLFKELSKNLSRSNEDVNDLEKAIKMIASIPDNEISEKMEIDDDKKINDDNTNNNNNQTAPASNIDFNLPGDSSEKLSNLLKNVLQAKDFFDVIDTDGKVRERFIFFFKSRMFITEINKNLSADQRTYNVEKIIKLPQVDISAEDANTLIIKSIDNDKSFPIRLRCSDQQRIKTWLDMINSLPKCEEDAVNQITFTPDKPLEEQQIKLPIKLQSFDENNNKISNDEDDKTTRTKFKDSRPPKDNENNEISQDTIEKKSIEKRKTIDNEVLEEPFQAKIIKPIKIEKIDSEPIDDQSNEYSIIRDLKSITKQVGDKATFHCQVTPGTTNVQWLKDNRILSGNNYRTYKKDDNYYLELNNLTIDDNGIYTFVASDSKTSVASTSTLNVLCGDSRPTSPGGSFLPHPPKFKVKLKDTDLLEGASCVRFELIVRGLPIPNIQIFKDNRPLEVDDRVQILFQSKEVFEIVLKNVCEKDAGIYRCIAINPEGQAETSGRITVSKNKDVFFGLDENAPIPKRDPHSPRCTSPAFKWFKDGKEFEASERFQVQFDDQEDTVALIFQKVTPDDAGLYTCVASTSSGKISCHAELNVQGVVKQLPKPPIAPQFLKELSNVEVCKGQKVALLEAQIIGFPKPIISWYKEDRKIESNDHYKMMSEGDENVTLMIKNVCSDDIGKYRLQAENKLGMVETTASLTIVKEPEFCKVIDHIEIDNKLPQQQQQQLIIEQKYDASPAPTTIKWEKDGQELAESKRIHKMIDEEKQIVRLIIDNVTSEDAGNYVCMIANNLGKAKQQTQVTVKSSAPKFLKKLQSIQVNEKENAIFTGQYNVDAIDTKIEFYKNDRLLELDERIQLKREKEGQFSLIINDTTVDDEGKYKCKIKNNQGSDEADASLIVIKKISTPKIKEKLSDLQVQIDDKNVQLQVKYDCEPQPKIKWFHNDKLIDENKLLKNKDNELPYKILNNDNNTILLIPKIEAEHSGQYKCQIENPKGKDECEAKLIVKQAPYVVKHLDNIDLSSDNYNGQEVKLTAIIKGTPKPNIIWTCNDQIININDNKKKYLQNYDEINCEYSLIIYKFNDNDLGEYKIQAKNEYGECESKSMVQITSKPIFSKVLNDVIAKKMDSNIEMIVQLDKKSAGKPTKVKWYKDNEEILDDKKYKKINEKLDNTYKLIIMNATEEMVGKYKCVVNNDFGSNECEAKFDLLIPPKFIKGLYDVDVSEGNNVSMTVQLAGFPNPEIKFYKDGEEINTSAHIIIRKEMDDIYQFEIENIRIIMSGEYECRIKNDAGEASSKGVITVNTKPEFLKDLNDQMINVGDDIQLEVTVTGQPSPKIKWFINGKEAKGEEKILFESHEESFAMKIPKAQVNDTGIYHCIASNKFGEQMSNKANVKVMDKNQSPQILKPIQDSSIIIDDNVRFETIITGVPKPDIIWTKDSVPLKSNNKNIIIKSEDDTHVLIMKNCQQKDSGVITCEAKNSAGSIKQNAQLEVEEPTIPSIDGLEDKYRVIDGEPKHFDAKIKGFPKPIVEWFHCDKDNNKQIPIEENDNITLINEPKQQKYGIDMKSFPSNMDGTYICRATNSAGTVEKEFSVEIGGKKPIFIKELDETQIVMSVDKQNNRLKLGQSAIFETIVDGVPTPDVQWLKNDKLLTPSPKILIESNEKEHKLEVKTISKEDVAKYTCKATNKYGEAQTVCLLKFLNEPHEPIIKKPLEDVKIEEGENLTMFCKVDGEPMPAVRWLKDQQPLEQNQDDRLKLKSESDGSTNLIIENVQKSDSGVYHVEAENAKGIAKTEAKVMVVEPKKPPTFIEPLKESIQIEENQQLILVAKVSGIPQPKIQWLKDGKPLTDKSPNVQIIKSEDGKCQLKIDQTKPQDSGVYSLKATNVNGEMLNETKVEISPKPYAPMIIEDLPKKLQIQVGEPIKIQSKIQSYPLAKLEWLKDSKPLSSSIDDRIKITDDKNGEICLSIEASKPEDQGVYKLIATNTVGEIASSTNIEILPKPITEEPMIAKDKKDKQQQQLQQTELLIKESLPNQQNINAGDDIHLKMKLSLDDNDLLAKKPITIDDVKIFKDNIPIQKTESNAIKINNNDGNIEFIHPKCSTNDSGLYRIEIQIPSTSQNLSNSCLVNVISDKDQKSGKLDDDDGIDKKMKQPLKFNRKLSDLMVESGEPCRLECSLDLNNNEININDLTILWFKDGEELLPGEHHGFVKEKNGTIALLIDSFSAKDIGNYDVKIFDKFGQTISSNGNINLKSMETKTKPEIIDNLSDININDGEQLCLQCHLKLPLSDSIQTKWFCNGKELQQTDSIKFLNFPDGTIMLQMNNISLNDSGEYKVIVSNKYGDTTSSGKVNVTKKSLDNKPKILKGLESTTLIAGKPGFIEFQIDLNDNDNDKINFGNNNNNDDIKFLIDSQLIQPDDRIHIQKLPDGIIRLKFDEVKLSDSGTYKGIYKNDFGTTESNCLVNVESKPIVITPLEDMSVKEKCSIKFEAKIKSNPDCEIVWLRNGSKIQIDNKHYVSTKTNDNIYTLTINDCSHRDKAEYSIKATNKHGSVISKASLDLLYSNEFEECPPSFTQQLNDLSVGKGDTVQLKAKIKAHPVPKITWKKDGQEISMSADKIFSSFNGEDLELTILNFDKSDIGIYEVSVGNALGIVNSSCRVVENAMTKPEFIKKLSDLETIPGNETKLKCCVRGYPLPDIQWTYNGRPIESGSKYSIMHDDRTGDQTLIIFEPTIADSGVYECIAFNTIGSDKTKSNVLFGEKSGEAAHFITKLQDCDCKPGSTARFNACVVGNPTPEYKWFKDDKEIKIDGIKYKFEINPNGMITLEINNINDNDLGRYRCMATNKFGSDNSIGQLNYEIDETTTGFDRMNQSHKSMKRIKDATNNLSFDGQTMIMSGVPKALTEKPIITKMIDDSLTLLWLPSIPEQPRFPVSYVVEFAKISDGIWNVCHGNIKDCKCDVIGLEKYEDYSFRVRVENKFGQSDPSPAVTAYRSQLKDSDAQEKMLKMDRKPDDYYLQHRPQEKVAAAPQFVRDEKESMFGIIGQPVTIEFWVYGYPEPKIQWFFNDKEIDSNDQKFRFLQDRNGKTCLFINRMTDSDVGLYTCIARNEHGEEKKTIKVVRADAPKFTKLLDETNVMARNHIRLSCSVISSPQATIKWFKDFQPLHDTSRLNIVGDIDNLTLTINDAIIRDSGLYSCTATNIAGSTTTSAYVTVNEQKVTYDKYPFSYKDMIKPKTKQMEQLYDIGDELGRGTQGITYHTVERSTGKSYAVKMMHGTGEMRQYMNSELDIMNQLGSHERLIRLHDCFTSTPYSMSLISSMSGGGKLMEYIMKKGTISEQEVADYIKQILEGLHYMHFKNIGHLGLTINDILMERIDGNDITICDFGLAQRLTPGASVYVEFGQPEFISPEIVEKNSVTLTTDTWSAGIIAHILLTGISPFLAENDRTTMHNIQDKKIDLSDEKLAHISEHGRDFLRKTLNYNPIERLDIKSALNHPWITKSKHELSQHKLDIMDKLREYKNRSDKWYQNASCRRYYRRRPLHSCYTHPSKMIYPPDEQYSPLMSPEREIKRFQRNVAPFDNVYPENQTFGTENFTSESHYQCGPDTYLLQLRDTDFPARIRRYLKIAAANSPMMASNLQQSHWSRTSYIPAGTFSQPSIKERRKFTDIMDEEISDEMRGKPGRKPRRLAREVGTPMYLHGQLKTLKKENAIIMKKEPQIDESDFVRPFFREKLHDTSFQDDGKVVFTCYAIGVPEPTYTWFRNDSIIIETNRTKVKKLDDGRCQLILDPAKEYDCGVYRCVARNTLGSVVCRARLSLGDVPNNVVAPSIIDYSNNSILLQWSTPKYIADAHIQTYRLEIKKSSSSEWSLIDGNIRQEFYLITNLESNQSYQFRLFAINKFGCSEASPPSDTINTLSSDEHKTIDIPNAMKFVCNDDLIVDNYDNNDYNQETKPIQLIKSEYKELYDFKSIIYKGKFSIITRTYIKDGSKKLLACKCVLLQSELESLINNEYEILKSLSHEKIIKLYYANRDNNLFTLAMELLSGLNILTYLCRKKYYNEQIIINILCQIIDAIQYLHYRNIALIELQPDNILVVNENSNLNIKLTDFSNAKFLSSKQQQQNSGNISANPEYIAPEIIRNDGITLPYSDVWTIGVLAYILLSGHSPFKGNNQHQTIENVIFVRYLFERLYTNVTQESIRFLLSVFKLTPHKRPTLEECFENKWILPNEFMMKKRESAIFDTKQLQIFTEQFMNEKCTSKHSRLLDLIGIDE